MNDVRLEAHGRLQFHSGIEEAAIPGDRENLLRWPHDRSCDAPGKGDAQGLVAVRDKDLAGLEAIEMASDPQVERTHIQAECNVTAKELLQFVHETQRMDRHAAASSCLLSQELTFRANHVEDYRRERRFLGPLNLRRQGLQGLSDIARQLDIGGIAVVEVRRQDVDVDDLAQALAVPKRWPTFDRIIPYGNDKVSGFEQPIGRLVSVLANPAPDVIEQHRAYGTRCLEHAERRQVVLANEGLKCPGVV